jgi:hypothetical protein
MLNSYNINSIKKILSNSGILLLAVSMALRSCQFSKTTTTTTRQIFSGGAISRLYGTDPPVKTGVESDKAKSPKLYQQAEQIPLNNAVCLPLCF